MASQYVQLFQGRIRTRESNDVSKRSVFAPVARSTFGQLAENEKPASGETGHILSINLVLEIVAESYCRFDAETELYS